jgi:hypothetical protein
LEVTNVSTFVKYSQAIREPRPTKLVSALSLSFASIRVHSRFFALFPDSVARLKETFDAAARPVQLKSGAHSRQQELIVCAPRFSPYRTPVRPFVPSRLPTASLSCRLRQSFAKAEFPQAKRNRSEESRPEKRHWRLPKPHR